MTKIAVLDDWQGVARESADWSRLAQRAELVFFEQPLVGPDAAVQALAEFDILHGHARAHGFPATLIARLPRLRMIALTGPRTWTMDIEACSARAGSSSATRAGRSPVLRQPSWHWALLLAATRHIPAADASMRAGVFQSGIPMGSVLDGRTLGVIRSRQDRVTPGALRTGAGHMRWCSLGVRTRRRTRRPRQAHASSTR